MVKVGDRVESINFGWMEVTSGPYDSEIKRNEKKVDVKFDNTNCIKCGVLINQFLLGAVRDSSVTLDPLIGRKFKSSKHGYVEVINYENSKSVTVKFDNTGNEQYVQLDNLLTGLFTDICVKKKHNEQLRIERKKKNISFTEELERREIRKQEVAQKRKERAEAANKRRIEELEKQERLQAERLRLQEEYENNLKEVLTPQVIDINLIASCKDAPKDVLDVDFKDRSGRWVLRFRHNKNFIQTRLGKLHNNVTQRANIKGSIQNKFSTTYTGVTISDEFKDPQSFCDWVVKQPGWGFGWSLDKDLLIPGNRTYSPEACVFLPQIINTSIIRNTGSKKTFIYESKGKYRLKFNLGTKEIVINNLDIEEEALKLYKEYREGYVKRLATEYRQYICPRAYNALMNWTLELE